MNWVFITAHDVWMFRDSKPFVAQQNFVARSQFPPTPQTMQGVIRSYFLEQQGVDWRRYARWEEDRAIYDVVGGPAYKETPATFGSLRIDGPHVARMKPNGEIERLYPAPADLLRHKETMQYAVLTPDRRFDGYTTPPFEGWLPLIAPDGDYEPVNGWLSEDQFTAYLTGKTIAGEVAGSVTETEERVGLAMNRRRRAAEQHLLYHAQFVRPQDDYGLLVGVNHEFIFNDYGILNIGGESRSGHYQYVTPRLVQPTATSGRIKVILQTPAYFSNGWQPGDWSPWIGSGRLVSFVMNRPQQISGWDVANQQPKSLRNFVPAGSVYYFDDAILNDIPFTETPEGDPDYGAMGFGGYITGSW